MKFPKVSICIPTYRQIDYLRGTLLSVRQQGFDNYELVISDDSPDDQVEKLVTSFDFRGKLKYFRNSSVLGSPENWNEAIRHADGEYIKIMHHDDKFSHSDALADFVSMLEENSAADFAFSGSLVEFSKNKEVVHVPSREQISRLSDFPDALFLGNLIGAPSATIYRRSLNINFDPRMKWLVDIDFYIQALSRNSNFVYCPDALVVTAADAPHQVTKSCENDPIVEMREHLLLYEKISASTSRPLFYLWPKWFRLFEKYKIYSLQDCERFGLSCAQLSEIFMAYRSIWLRRFPYRIKVRARNVMRSLSIRRS